MNKKVLTLCAGALLAGGVSLAYVAPVNAALPAITAVAADATQTEAPTFAEGKVTELKGNYTVADNGTLVIDEEGATLEGNGFTLTGHLVIKANNVTVQNLNIKSVTTGSTRYTKTAITVGEDTAPQNGEANLTGIVIDNVKIICEADAKKNFLANGISINTAAKDATCKIVNSTITSSTVKGEGWYPVGIIVNAPNSAISAADYFKAENNNTFPEGEVVVAAVQYAKEGGYDYAHIVPDDAKDNGLDLYILSVLNKIKNDGTLAVDAKAEDVLSALAKATAEDDNEVNDDVKAAIVAADQNLLFGGATAPDNTNPSNVVLVGQDGKVTADLATAPASIGGCALKETVSNGDGYFMLGFESQKTDGKYYVANSENKVTEFTGVEAVDPNYLWKVNVDETPTGIVKYVFTNLATGKELVTTGNAGTGKDGEFLTVGNATYHKGFVLAVGNTTLDDATNNYWGLYESGEKAFEADYLNDLEGASFALTIKDNTGKKDVLQGAEAFASSIVAVPDNNATSYQFMVGDKYIVLDTEDKWSDNGIAPDKLGYKFKTISEDVLNKDTKGRYMSTFSIKYLAGDNTDKDAEPTNKTAIERITVTSKDGKTTYSLATYNSDGKDYLTVASAENENLYAVISFGSGNRTDITTLLTGKFATIEFVNKEYKTYADGETVDKNQQYKMDKMLAMEADKNGSKLQAEYIGTTKGEYPEAQWAISMNDDNTATFTNRENPDVKVEHVVLYNTDVDDVYAITSVNGDGDSNYASYNVAAKDTIKLTFVTTGMFDGFKYVDLAGLQDTVYNIAAFKAVNEVNDAYWVEKNHSTTHQIGLDGDIENAGEWNLHVAMKPQLDADGEKVKDAKGDIVMVPDTVFVKSTLYTWDAAKKEAKPSENVLAIFPYEIQNNDNNEFIRYDNTHGVEYYVADESKKEYMADHFALKIQPDGYHIVTLETWGSNEELMKPYENYENEVLADRNWVTRMGDKVFAGNAASRGTLDKIANYTSVYNDVMTITPVAMPEYRPVVKANESAFDTVRIYRDENHSQLLYEKKDAKSVVEKDTLSFLNIDNENQFKLADAIFVDTAYVNRGTNTCWQYLLVVQPKNVSEWYCPVNEEHNTEAWREANGVEHCHDAIRKNYVEGRFLINLMDTANVYETTTQHDNPYIHEVEAGDVKAKLAFVPGKHFGDTLVIYKDAAMTQVKDSLFLGDKDFNIAKFAFRYEDNATQSFKIQTQYKGFKYGNLKADDYVSNDGYLRWVNGTVVVDEGYDKGDVFNMTESYEGNPTANEEISANAAVSVVATDGAVIVKGAEGKNVIVSTILGKVVANEVLNSDNETIAAPAGIVVVSVDGESFKVAVK